MSGDGKPPPPPGPPALPVDPERLRKEFPGLTDDDLAAFTAVTQRILQDPAARPRRIKEVMDAARRAGEKAAAGAELSAEETLSQRYLQAVRKMQKKPAPPS